MNTSSNWWLHLKKKAWVAHNCILYLFWYSYTFRAHQDQKREWVITAIFLVRDQPNAIIISKVVACLLQLISWKFTGDLIQLLLWNNFPKPSWTIRAQALQGSYELPFHRGFLSHCILNRALLSCSQASIQLFVGHLLDDRAFNVWWCCFSERDLLYYCTLSHCFFNKSGVFCVTPILSLYS